MLRQSYSMASDLWSVEVIMYVMLVADFPFDGVDSASTKKAVLKASANQRAMQSRLLDHVGHHNMCEGIPAKIKHAGSRGCSQWHRGSLDGSCTGLRVACARFLMLTLRLH